MADETTPAPIVVDPSQRWEGNDGPWSTFDLHIGTPPQPVRGLVSTTSGETWVISANKTVGGCIESQDPDSCPQSRGALFNINSSSTWQDQGLWSVELELNLPDYGGEFDVGNYGLETVGLGLPGSSRVTEPNLIVAALATKSFYLGHIGLSNQPTNFSQFDDPHPSLLTTLKTENKIPSLSYGYSAGAPYRFKKVQGTLTLGGFDASKFIPNDVDFRFASDISRDLVVGLQSITYSDSESINRPLLTDGILTFIDSTVPEIWLPQEACTNFENAFGISYNDTVDRYIVNDTLRETMRTHDASVSFIIGNNIRGGNTVNVTLPYSAFDLKVDTPIVNSTQNYFPLRRAENETQYTMGRAFLQEAYLTVNYERANFSISQNTWVDNAPQHIVAIRSINSTDPAGPDPPKKSSGISTGAIVGVIVAAVVLVLLAAVAAFFVIRKRRRKNKEMAKKEEDDDSYRKPEMDGTGKDPIGELYAEGKLGEVDSSSKVEMQGSQPGISQQDKTMMAEIEGSRGGVEMEGTRGEMEMEGSHLRAEMAGDHLAPVELDAGPQGFHELPSPNTSNSELPSPLSSNSERRSRLSATWSRRQKPRPQLPSSESSDGSSDAAASRQGNGAGRTIEHTMRAMSPSLTPGDMSSTTSQSRERRPSRTSSHPNPSRHPNNNYNHPNDPLPSNAALEMPDRRQASASPRGMSSPRDQSSRRTDSAEENNRRLGSRERNTHSRSPDALSPVSPIDRAAGIVRRPSPLGNAPTNGTPRASPPPNRGVPRERSPRPPGNFF